MGHTTAGRAGVCSHRGQSRVRCDWGALRWCLSKFGWLIVSEKVAVRSWKQEFVWGWDDVTAQTGDFRRFERCCVRSAVYVRACIRKVSRWMLPLSWSVFLSGQQIDRPPYWFQLLLLCSSSITHKSVLLSSSVTCSHFPTLSHNFFFCLSLSSTLYPVCVFMFSIFSLFPFVISFSNSFVSVFPLFPVFLYLFSHFISISAHHSFLSAAQSQRVDDLAEKNSIANTKEINNVT